MVAGSINPVNVIFAFAPVAEFPAVNTCCNVCADADDVIQETPPEPVDDNICPAVPVVTPSYKLPDKAIAAVDDVVPVALKVLFPLKVFVPAEEILLLDPNVHVLVPLSVTL